jgi:hypothetical protein
VLHRRWEMAKDVGSMISLLHIVSYMATVTVRLLSVNYPLENIK